MSGTNVDKRGVKRGRCLIENCDCEMFESNGSNQCEFCGCFAAKHGKYEGEPSSPRSLISGSGGTHEHGDVRGSAGGVSLKDTNVSLKDTNEMVSKSGGVSASPEVKNTASVVVETKNPVSAPTSPASTIPVSPASSSSYYLRSAEKSPSTLKRSNAFSAKDIVPRKLDFLASSPKSPRRLQVVMSANGSFPSKTNAKGLDTAIDSKISSTPESASVGTSESALKDEDSARKKVGKYSSKHRSYDSHSGSRRSSSRHRSSKDKKGNDSNSSVIPRREKLEKCLPDMWPSNVQTALDKCAKNEEVRLTLSVKNAIKRILVDRAIQNGLSLDDFDDVAQVAWDKVPALRSQIVNNSSGLAVQPKQCFRNRENYSTRKNKTDVQEDKVDGLSQVEIKNAMVAESQKENPSRTHLKALLRSCREQRTKDSKKASASVHMKEYPALKISGLVTWEFSEMVGISLNDLRLRWVNAIPKFKKFLKIVCEEDTSDDILTAQILKGICSEFRQRSKSREPIFKCHETGTLITDTIPPADRGPCLVAVGDISKALIVSVYVDSVPIYSGNIIEALLTMVSAYWVFQVEYPSGNKLAVMLLSTVFIQEKMLKDISKFSSIVAALEQLELF